MEARIGRYTVQSEVARGGMGVVYRALDPEGATVALKLLASAKGADPTRRRRFATEVQSLLRLRHPRVVAIQDAGEQDDVPFLVMEWIEGESLGARLERAGPLEVGAAIDLVRELAGALEHCHAQGVIHRDLKPDNVLLRASDGAPLLTDFGLARDLEARSTSGATQADVAMGTPGYWPPEQATGRHEAVGPRSDVYGLGALLYAALTGLPPRGGATIQEVLAALERPVEPPGRLREGVPSWLDAVCLQALASAPDRRPSGPAALARELERGGRLAPARIMLLLAAVLGVGITALRVVDDRPTAVPSSAPSPASSSPAAAPASSGPLPSPPGGEASELLRMASVHEGAGNRRSAIALLDQYLAIDPSSSQVLVWRGVLRAREGEVDAALADCERAVANSPGNAEAYAARGYVRELRGELEEAIRDGDRAVAIDPSCGVGYANRGSARAKAGQLEPALRDFERALSLAPDAYWAAEIRGLRDATLGALGR